MARGTIVPTLLVFLLAVCCATSVVHGKEWTVGDNKGWSFGVSGWENGKRIQSGDVLVFKYNPSMHNVVQVGEADYNSCTVSGPSRAYTSGNDHIQLARGGKAFFLCSVPGHCQKGMKIAVTA
ncbi:Chemocyanin [Hordeum vulgare]|uniref:Plantacyanin n=1 Tax=Hordeum vulgare subsp. vulgare TaxID=112509 RepID=A0A8I6XM59_HORVV|nr:basic blue protein-like [Hordeum vulgare subsp. vulgare]XP_044949460.1 basic blue protein-like [Hordeum vulgare subsp. vulgare]KAE8781092.1 Chemocyanin [Hordeum vulgare]